MFPLNMGLRRKEEKRSERMVSDRPVRLGSNPRGTLVFEWRMTGLSLHYNWPITEPGVVSLGLFANHTSCLPGAGARRMMERPWNHARVSANFPDSQTTARSRVRECLQKFPQAISDDAIADGGCVVLTSTSRRAARSG